MENTVETEKENPSAVSQIVGAVAGAALVVIGLRAVVGYKRMIREDRRTNHLCDIAGQEKLSK
jgi:hypothetical protein